MNNKRTTYTQSQAARLVGITPNHLAVLRNRCTKENGYARPCPKPSRVDLYDRPIWTERDVEKLRAWLATRPTTKAAAE